MLYNTETAGAAWRWPDNFSPADSSCNWGIPKPARKHSKVGAVLTVKASGCHDPATAKVTATAIGMVNGERREIALKVMPLSGAGMFAIAQQWPREGKWVIQLVGRNGEQFTNTLVGAGPDGVDRTRFKENYAPLHCCRCRSYAEVGCMLVSVEPAEDDALIRAAANGDRAAFGELYVRYARMVHGILLVRVPPGDAEDLVQEVFLSAMRQLRGLRTAAAFRGWLGAIARNRAIDYFREPQAE